MGGRIARKRKRGEDSKERDQKTRGFDQGGEIFHGVGDGGIFVVLDLRPRGARGGGDWLWVFMCPFRNCLEGG